MLLHSVVGHYNIPPCVDPVFHFARCTALYTVAIVTHRRRLSLTNVCFLFPPHHIHPSPLCAPFERALVLKAGLTLSSKWDSLCPLSGTHFVLKAGLTASGTCFARIRNSCLVFAVNILNSKTLDRKGISYSIGPKRCPR